MDEESRENIGLTGPVPTVDSADDPSTVSSISSSQPHLPDSSTSPDGGDEMYWYRSRLRPLYLVCGSVLLALNLLSLVLERDACNGSWNWRGYGEDVNSRVHRILSIVLYSLVLLYLAVYVPHYINAVDVEAVRRASGSSSAAGLHHLMFSCVSALGMLLLSAMAIYSLVTLGIGTDCAQRVFFAFVLTLDCAVPVFVCLCLLSYALLQTISDWRRKQDEGVESSSLRSLHLTLYCLAFFFCILNLCAVVLHKDLIRDHSILPMWVFIITQTVLWGVAATVLLLSLLYRVSLTPQHQHQLLTFIVAELSQFSVALLVVLCLLWAAVLLLCSLLMFAFFCRHPSVGGMAVVAWCDLLLTGLSFGSSVHAAYQHGHDQRLLDFAQDVWRKVKGEGQITGIYAHTALSTV
jgi:hypothetical protein